MKEKASTLFVIAMLVLATKSTARELLGPWKEVQRISPAGEAVAFTDTMRIRFLLGNEYTWHRPAGFIYRGTYKLTDKALDMGSLYFNIVRMSDDLMVLSNTMGQFTFARDPNADNVRADNSAASHSDRAAAPDRYSGPPSNIDALKGGRWEVYKRTSSAVQDQIDYTRQLRAIELRNNKGGEQGLIYSSSDLQNKPSWYVDRYKNGVMHLRGRDARQLKILHLSDGELIVAEGPVTYFLKQFKQ